MSRLSRLALVLFITFALVALYAATQGDTDTLKLCALVALVEAAMFCLMGESE